MQLLYPLLTVLFVGLKLTNQIDWSWAWVLFFVWFPPLLIVVVIIGVVIFKVKRCR